jgi:hypothetical protein
MFSSEHKPLCDTVIMFSSDDIVFGAEVIMFSSEHKLLCDTVIMISSEYILFGAEVIMFSSEHKLSLFLVQIIFCSVQRSFDKCWLVIQLCSFVYLWVKHFTANKVAGRERLISLDHVEANDHYFTKTIFSL